MATYAQIEHFVAAAQQNNLHSYADASGYDYSYIKKEMRNLQKWAGFQLFLHGNVKHDGGGLTPEGKVFLPYAERALAAFRAKDFKQGSEILAQGKLAMQVKAKVFPLAYEKVLPAPPDRELPAPPDREI